MQVTVKENPFTPEGKSDEISEYLAVGSVLYTQDEMTSALDAGKAQWDRAEKLQGALWVHEKTNRELNAKLAQLRSENSAMIEGAYYRTLEKAQAVPQPLVLLSTPPSHEESYSNNLTEALREIEALNKTLAGVMQQRNEHLTERDTLRDVLTLLAPDLKTMAILYQQQGDHTRAQALMNICKSVGVV